MLPTMFVTHPYTISNFREIDQDTLVAFLDISGFKQYVEENKGAREFYNESQ